MSVVTPGLSRRNGGRTAVVGGGGRGDMNLNTVSSLRYKATAMVGVVVIAAAVAATSAMMTRRTIRGG